MGEKGTALKGDLNKQGWEKSDFPILCDTCLGDNPYVRMTKSEFARECKVCQRPFTVFRWKPDSAGSHQLRYKKTEICCTCAKLKNVCQTCLFDLDFGLPVELRDKFIDQSQQMIMPKEQANKDYWANNVNLNIDKLVLPFQDPQLKQTLAQVAMQHQSLSSKVITRNKAHVCSFFVRGECNRGLSCPYRHTDITEKDLESMKKGYGSIEEKIKERYHGINDPIASKILSKIKEKPKAPEKPADQSITTLFVGGITAKIEESDLTEKLNPFGKIVRQKLLPNNNCGFVCFNSRESAEKAMETLFDKLYVGDLQLKLMWAKNQLQESHKKKHLPVVPEEQQQSESKSEVKPVVKAVGLIAYTSDDEKSD